VSQLYRLFLSNYINFSFGGEIFLEISATSWFYSLSFGGDLEDYFSGSYFMKLFLCKGKEIAFLFSVSENFPTNDFMSLIVTIFWIELC
jgi:hypothetical protein